MRLLHLSGRLSVTWLNCGKREMTFHLEMASILDHCSSVLRTACNCPPEGCIRFVFLFRKLRVVAPLPPLYVHFQLSSTWLVCFSNHVSLPFPLLSPYHQPSWRRHVRRYSDLWRCHGRIFRLSQRRPARYRNHTRISQQIPFVARAIFSMVSRKLL